MQLPKVSIVTITYKHEKYILEALKSFLDQKYEGPIEIIIANDNSPDNTHRVISDFFATTNIPSNFEIKYTNHEVNKGMMKNFIWSLQQATGKYIALCEGDDYWIDPLKLQKQVDFLNKYSETELVFHNCYILDEIENGKFVNTRKPLTKSIESREYTSIEILEEWVIPTASIVFKRETLVNGNFYTIAQNKNFIYGDIVLFLYLASKGKVFGISDTMSVYRIHKGGVTKYSSNNRLNRITHFKEIFKVFGGKFKTKKIKWIIAKHYLDLYRYGLNYNFVQKYYFLISSLFYDYTLVTDIIINKMKTWRRYL